MRVGISTATFFNRIYNEDAFAQLKELGCDLTEVFFTTYSEYEKEFVQKIARAKGDITVHSVHALGTQFEPELFNVSPRVRADAEKIFRKVCDASRVLGAKYLTFHGPYIMKKQEYVIDFEKLGNRINELIDIAKSYGVCLSYENVHYAFFNHPSFFTKLKRYCPEIWGTLDIKQSIQGGVDPYDMLEAIGDRLSTIHICDIKDNNQTAIIGQGAFDFEKFINTLKSKDIAAPVILELYSTDYDTMDELKQNYEYIKKLAR
jgi:sugar phosphate isomerase/epimerase